MDFDSTLKRTKQTNKNEQTMRTWPVSFPFWGVIYVAADLGNGQEPPCGASVFTLNWFEPLTWLEGKRWKGRSPSWGPESPFLGRNWRGQPSTRMYCEENLAVSPHHILFSVKLSTSQIVSLKFPKLDLV